MSQNELEQCQNELRAEKSEILTLKQKLNTTVAATELEKCQKDLKTEEDIRNKKGMEIVDLQKKIDTLEKEVSRHGTSVLNSLLATTQSSDGVKKELFIAKEDLLKCQNEFMALEAAATQSLYLVNQELLEG